MNRTIRLLALAAPLATVSLSLGATPAMAAEPTEPSVLTLPTDGDPEPRPEIDDKAPPPEDPDRPDDGPGEIKDNEPCPTHGSCEDDPGDEGKDDPSDEIRKPTRIDAGAGTSDKGLELAWLLAGGALITASGVAMAATRRPLTEA